ncbi:uncharacterized protein LOC126687776 [Mercurialis annua]|uniref:uncharacterized protein LOC126687776 n=1 Tax=Mercurialis annua TaxID=3986 RepID=UPI0024AD4049|nr:uncharacterized protein LOC126687776 [Mercurialis annua]
MNLTTNTINNLGNYEQMSTTNSQSMKLQMQSSNIINQKRCKQMTNAIIMTYPDDNETTNDMALCQTISSLPSSTGNATHWLIKISKSWHYVHKHQVRASFLTRDHSNTQVFRVRKERLLHSGPISRSMREIFRKCWFENGRAWRFLTAEQTDFYWEEFKKEYWWDTADYSDDVIKSVFMAHAANRYKDVIHRMREKDEKHTSISQVIWDSWKAVWASEDKKKKSDVARANRMSEPAGAGSGPVRHTGGSRSAIRHMDVLAEELGRKPTATELYTRMHSTKADKGVMVDKRAQNMSDAIAQRLAAASQPPTDGGSSSTAEVDETQLFLDIEGVNKKRRVYGLGSATSAYVDTTTSSRARTRSTQSQRTEEEIERRVRAGIQDGLRQITTEVEDLRAQQARANERMAEIIQAEMAKMMQTLPPQYRPPPP